METPQITQADNIEAIEEIKDTPFARAAFVTAFIPFFGIILFILLSLIALIHMSKGRLGFYRLRNGAVVCLLTSLIPVLVLVLWAGLPSKYYFFLNKHGVVRTSDDNIKYYRFGSLIKHIENKNNTQYERIYWNDQIKSITCWYNNGNLRSKMQYENSFPQGEYFEWYNDRQDKLFIRYDKGYPVGVSTSWYQNGQKQSEGGFSKGQYHGKWHSWYSNGVKRFEIEYQEGKPVNAFTSWYDNGQVAIRGNYTNGVRTGPWISYERDGKVALNIADYIKYELTERGIDRKYYPIEYYFFQERTEYERRMRIIGDDIRYNKDYSVPTGRPIIVWVHNMGGELDSKTFTSKDIINDFIKNIISGAEYCGHDNVNYYLSRLPVIPMTVINLSRSRDLSEDYLASMRGMPIQDLNLDSCDTTEYTLVRLQGMPLNYLSLSFGYKITQTGYAHLLGMPLTGLSLYNANVNDICLPYLRQLNLEYLDLQSNDITDAGLKTISKMPIQILNLWSCRLITDIGIGHLKDMPLRYLNLRNCIITDTELASLQNTQLFVLDLHYTKITNTGLSYLAQMPLNRLDLSACDDITDLGLLNLRKLPLIYLDLRGCSILDKPHQREFNTPQEIQNLFKELEIYLPNKKN